MAKHALYRFYGDTGTLLYTGITNNPARRFTQHEETKEWWHSVRGITIDWYDTRPDAEAAERRAIHVEQPRHNKVRPVPRPVDKRCGHCDECNSGTQCQNLDALETQCNCDDKTCWAYTGGLWQGRQEGYDRGCAAGEYSAATRVAEYILNTTEHTRSWADAVAGAVVDDLNKHDFRITPYGHVDEKEDTCESDQSNQSSGGQQT